MRVANISSLTGRKHEMELPVTFEEIERFEGGELAQSVWPNLTAEQRDFLILGVTPDEAKALLPPEDA